MSTTIVTPDQDAIVSEIQINAPAERIFKALTDAAELKRWFTNPECPVKSWQMDARVGGSYSYATEKGSIVVNGVSEFKCQGEILECDPPRVLVYTWIASWHDDTSKRTVVRWELAPKQGGTHVKVTHSGLASLPIARKDYSGGWPGVVEMLKNFVEK
ncbi:MAG: SRPBCC domain-containing protein [Candidatus Sulfotelmatobacter sp.]